MCCRLQMLVRSRAQLETCNEFAATCGVEDFNRDRRNRSQNRHSCAGGPGRYFTGLFLLFWLGIWIVAFKDVGSKVVSGNANGFMVFWLGGWTLGGIFAALSLYRAARPSVPESLELKRNSVTYGSGVAAPVRLIPA